MNETFLETIQALDGEVMHLSYHQARYESVLKHFGVREVQNLSECIVAPQRGVVRCRFVYDLHGDSQLSYHPYQKREIGLLKLVHDNTIEYSMKYANRERLDALFCLREEADDVLIVKNDLVTDTTIANVAFFDGKRWLTPASPLLRGTTRERLLDEGRIFEEEIRTQDLERFSKVALMNAMVDFAIIAKNPKELFC